MLMALYTSRRRLPWLVGASALLLGLGLIALLA